MTGVSWKHTFFFWFFYFAIFSFYAILGVMETQLLPLSASQWFLLCWRLRPNGHISCRLVPLRRLGDAEVIPSSLLSSTPGIHHFISAVVEDGWGWWGGGKRHQSLSLLSNSSSSQVFNVNNGLPETNEPAQSEA